MSCKYHAGADTCLQCNDPTDRGNDSVQITEQGKPFRPIFTQPYRVGDAVPNGVYRVVNGVAYLEEA